jgi:hypothetical protein
MDPTGQMDRKDRPQLGRQSAFRMLDANGNGRLEPPEIRARLEMLERLLGRSEREPINLDDFMSFGPPAGPTGPRGR